MHGAAHPSASSRPPGPIRVTLSGVGTAGRDFTRVAAATDDIEIVSACSRNPRFAGEDLAELAGIDAPLPAVVSSLGEAFATPSDVLVLATASHLADVGDDIRAGIDAGRNVITTAEEAAFPWANDEALAKELDERARAAGVTVLGTGVNPGFTFDALVITASGAAWDVTGFRVERIVDISGYGEAILRRSGVGFSAEEFERGCREGSITGHIGFRQSMYVVAHALGRRIERIQQSIEPILSETELEVNGVAIAPGQTAGFTQRHVAIVDGEEWFVAHLVAHVAMEDAGLAPKDTIEIAGSVPVRLVADPGVNSQTTVAAVIANSVRRVVAAEPGWRTVAELPPAHPTGERRPQASLLAVA